MPREGAWGGACIRTCVAVLATVALGEVSAAPANAAYMTMEGEAVAGAGEARDDASASSGRALRLPDGAVAEGMLTTGDTSVHLFVRAQGDWPGPATPSKG